MTQWSTRNRIDSKITCDACSVQTSEVLLLWSTTLVVNNNNKYNNYYY